MAEKVTRNNQSADKILNVVETMVRGGMPMRLSDIAKQSGLPQSTAFRMINALRERGYVGQDDNTEKYFLTLKFSVIGDMVRAKFDLRDLVHPYMVRIAEQCHNICYLGVERQGELVYIDMATPPGAALTRMPFIGKHVPLHCGGIGMVILSGNTEIEVNDYLNELGDWDIIPEAANDPGFIRGKLEEIRSRGYAVLADRIEPDKGSVAVGLYDYSGKAIAGLSVGGAITDFTPEYVEKVHEILWTAAADISQKLGYNIV